MAMFGRGPLFGQDTCGVGVRLKLDNDGKIRVNELLPGSPAHVHGVHVGDAFEFIDGVEIKNKTVEEVTRMLRGPAGSTVSLRMARNTFFGRDVLNIIIQRAEIAHRKTNDKDLHGAGTLRREPSPRANAHAASKSPTNDPEHFGSAIRSMFNFGSVASDGSVGLGCEVVNGMVRVKALKPGSPAAQSGLISVGDEILKIDRQQTACSLQDIGHQIRGVVGSNVTLEIRKRSLFGDSVSTVVLTRKDLNGAKSTEARGVEINKSPKSTTGISNDENPSWSLASVQDGIAAAIPSVFGADTNHFSNQETAKKSPGGAVGTRALPCETPKPTKVAQRDWDDYGIRDVFALCSPMSTNGSETVAMVQPETQRYKEPVQQWW